MKTLRGVKVLNVARELIGMAVLAPETGKNLGEVMDALIHPTEGRVVALLLRTTENELRALAAADLTIEGKAIKAREDAPFLSNEDVLSAGEIYASEDIVGAFVITDSGSLLGRVSEVHISIETRRVYYRVVKSEWQRLMGGGFFIAGDGRIPTSIATHA